ncbi:MAG TPA: hypothetical protein VF157_13340 [Chloroflexota bacterium]
MSSVTVAANLEEMTQETDFDIHLAISLPEDPSQTMIAEFPRKECGGAVNSFKWQDMATARDSFTGACGQPEPIKFIRLQGSASITGVAFFDEIHGQTGVAPNGIELHPVLHVEDDPLHAHRRDLRHTLA